MARLTDGSPLLVDRTVGSGRVLVFASTFDNIANDLPLHASFVPFVEQSAFTFAASDAVPAQYMVDSFVDLKGGGEILGPGRAARVIACRSCEVARFPLDEGRLLGSAASERTA